MLANEEPSPSSSSIEPTTSQQVRFRKTGRPATIAEENGLPRQGSIPRRTSSFMSDSSFDRYSFRSSTDDLLHPRPNASDELHEEPSLWYSLPLLFALIPAIGGIFFKRGAVVITDFILLVFAAIYLNWCLVTPWHWYHSAQTIKIAKPLITESVIETPDEQAEDNDEPVDAEDESADKVNGEQEQDSSHSAAALRELQIHELVALSLCFLGPVLGAYILHIVRHNLSHLADEMISSLHLTLFVLASELRPLRYCLKMVQARSLHLQRVVRQDPHAAPAQQGEVGMDDLNKRLLEMESVLAMMKTDHQSPAADSLAASTADAVKRSQATMQGQIDALNRAVRRYEKRATAQTIQNEARLQDLESRLRDAISLAAAAANYGQEPGILRKGLSWLTTILLAPLRALSAFVSLPFKLVADTMIKVLLRLGLVQDTRPKRSAQRARSRGDRLAPKGTIKR